MCEEKISCVSEGSSITFCSDLRRRIIDGLPHLDRIDNRPVANPVGGIATAIWGLGFYFSFYLFECYCMEHDAPPSDNSQKSGVINKYASVDSRTANAANAAN